ncbi:hypothetical protein PAXRUDRAFT_796041, partial [Paxillus rubicundulus Ve08.2h10]
PTGIVPMPGSESPVLLQIINSPSKGLTFSPKNMLVNSQTRWEGLPGRLLLALAPWAACYGQKTQGTEWDLQEEFSGVEVASEVDLTDEESTDEEVNEEGRGEEGIDEANPNEGYEGCEVLCHAAAIETHQGAVERGPGPGIVMTDGCQ